MKFPFNLPSIPIIPTPYKILAAVLAFLAVVSFSFYKGYEYKGALVAKKQAKEIAAAYERGIKSVKVNEKVVTIYKDRIITVNKEVNKYVDRVQYVVKDSDNINLPAGIGSLYDESLQTELSFTSDGPDGETAEASGGKGVQGVEGEEQTDLRTYVELNIHNNGICKANAIQLESLQFWVIEQQKIAK